MQWWREARFGLFIHWGLYAIPAGEWGGKTNYGEWIRNNAQIPLPTYDKFVAQFNPVKFDAAAWVRMAKDAGMKYIVITSKHHDGFAIFDSKVSDFDVMATPLQARHPQGAGRCLPQGGDQALLLPLHHGLAPSRLSAAPPLGGQGHGRRRGQATTAMSPT